jgi:hypothetical protein
VANESVMLLVDLVLCSFLSSASSSLMVFASSDGSSTTRTLYAVAVRVKSHEGDLWRELRARWDATSFRRSNDKARV